MLCSLFFVVSGGMAAPGDLLVTTSSARLLAEARSVAPVVAEMEAGETGVELARSPGRKYVRIARQGSNDKGWVAADLVEKAPARITLTTDFTDLGYPSGYLIEGPENKQAHHFYFTVPSDTVIDSGVLRVRFRASEILGPLSSLRVDVNDTPRATVRLARLAGEGDLLTIPLAGREIKAGPMKLTLWTTLVVEEDRCLDARVNNGYLQVLPDTSLSLDIRRAATSVRGFWALLPKAVQISIPNRALREEEFRVAWEMGEMLVRQGKKVSFVSLPTLGQVVVAPAAEIRAALDEHYRDWPAADGGYHFPEKSGQMGLVTAVGGSFLALTEPFTDAPLYLLEQRWRAAVAGRWYRGLPLTGKGGDAQDRYEFRLADLGMDTSPRLINSEVAWKLALSSDNAAFPPDYIPEQLNLEVVASPSQTEDPLIMSVYLNDVLQEVLQFKDDGRTHSFSVNLLPEHVRFYNELRFVALRSDEMGDCKGAPTQYPIQILPQSRLVMKRVHVKPARFSELRPYFAEGYQLLLPRTALARPHVQLALLARLTADLALEVKNGQLLFFDPAKEVRPTAPFLLVGKAAVALDRVPVHLDRGAVKMMDDNNRTVLNTVELPGITVAQVVESGSHYGLWLAPAHDGDLTAIQTLHLNDNDVAFLDARGVQLTFDSRRDVFLKPYYPKYSSWFDLLGRYRYWLVALGWLFFGVGAIYLFRQNMRSRRQQE
ncbi:MAG: cellulose biosynthesis cyclic di-GMP-binding regulatory protein BcsB [Desulfobulbaceae bacterium]|nr:cellulose biosynthesis cyclic di-GMP-binding regulatory protein BcsB [Desulfobulbaceae bacterium]